MSFESYCKSRLSISHEFSYLTEHDKFILLRASLCEWVHLEWSWNFTSTRHVWSRWRLSWLYCNSFTETTFGDFFIYHEAFYQQTICVNCGSCFVSSDTILISHDLIVVFAIWRTSSRVHWCHVFGRVSRARVSDPSSRRRFSITIIRTHDVQD